MPFIGVQPASALLTSADIQDGQITTAKIADDAVTGSKIENNPTIAGNLAVSGTSTLTGAVEETAMTIARFHKTNNETISGNKTPIDDLTNSSGSHGFVSRGTQPTNSSGTLTLPSTGLWRVDAMFGIYTANAYSYLYGQIVYSTDSGSNYSASCTGYQELAQNNSSGLTTTYCHINTYAIFNCTNTSTFRLRFNAGGDGSNFILYGGVNTTFLIQKIGASQ